MGVTPPPRTATDRPRRRGSRGRPARGRWVLPALLAVVTVAVLLAYFTPVLGVRSVRVSGTSISQDEIVRTAGIELGTPMLKLDPVQIQQHLEDLPKVRSADVSLSWPSTLDVLVVERTPVAFLVARNGIALVDAEGVPFEAVAERPGGLPELVVREASEHDPATQSALAVLQALPPQVRADVTAVVADQPTDVRLLLTRAREVHWGTQEELQRKAAILPALLTRPGRIFDVTTPALPTVA